MISSSGSSKNNFSKRFVGGSPERKMISNLAKKQTSKNNSLISLLLLLNSFNFFIALANFSSIFDSIER